MAVTYTAWPTVAQVSAFLTSANISPTLQTSDDLYQVHIDAASAEMGKRTQRQFVAGSAGEVRYYDGSGDGMQPIDEFIDVSAVQFLMYPQVAGIDIQYWYEPSRNGYPQDVLQIYQGPANTNYGYVANFPLGRSNIKVTGQFGYAATIPAPVWMAVLKKAAASIAAANTLDAQGKMVSETDGDADHKYGGDMPGDTAGWLEDFEAAVKAYKRPLKTRRRRQKAALL